MAGISPCAGGTRQPCLAAQRYVRSTDGTCTSSFHVNTYKNTHMDIYAYRAPITRLINNLQNSFRKQKKKSAENLAEEQRCPCARHRVHPRLRPCSRCPWHALGAGWDAGDTGAPRGAAPKVWGPGRGRPCGESPVNASALEGTARLHLSQRDVRGDNAARHRLAALSENGPAAGFVLVGVWDTEPQ